MLRGEAVGRWAAAAALALLLASCAFSAYVADGFFLSDDFVQLANFARWEDEHRLGREVLRFFVASIDGVNGFWRPLTFGSFAVNYALAGASATAWLAVNLTLHVANAILVGALVERLGRVHGPRASAAALFSAILFFAFAGGWETAAWVSGRYDTLAGFFSLLAAWWFAGGSVRKALAAAALALMSKESGAAALVFVGLIAAAGELANPSASSMDRARRLVARLWPFLLLGMGYAALRIALFGSATQVYTGVAVDLASSAHWTALVQGAVEWIRVNFPAPRGLRVSVGVATLVLLVVGLLFARRSRGTLLGLLAALATSVVALLLVLRHLPSLDPTGVGGRLFYFPAASFTIALGIACGCTLSAIDERPAWRLGCGVLMGFLALSHLHWMWRAAREYHRAHHDMRAVAMGIAQIASTSNGALALILIPDTLGRVPFGRNAQAGLMLPPVQSASLTSRVLVQIEAEIPDIPSKVSRGIFDWLTRNSLFTLPEGSSRLPGASDAEPSAYFCWSTRERRFARMAVAVGERSSLAGRIAQAHAAAGCRPADASR